MIEVNAHPVTESDGTGRVIKGVVEGAIDGGDFGNDSYRAR